MPSPPARKADRVAHDLLARIVEGELQVGALLPKEAALAERYGVNRSVVREAIKLLEVHRLVRPIRRRGTEVLDPLASLSPQVIRTMLRPRAGVVDRGILADLLEVRAELDVQMTGLAAERRTDADLAIMDDCVERMRDALAEPQRYRALMSELARAIARATRNRILEMLVHFHDMVHADLEDIFSTVRPASEPHLTGLSVLVELIRRQDVAQARALVAAFHDWATPRILAIAALSAGEPLERVMEEAR